MSASRLSNPNSPHWLKKWLKSFWWLLIVVVIASAGSVYAVNWWQAKNKPATDQPVIDLTDVAEPIELPPDPLRPVNVLLLGYGGAGHDGGALTDTMMVAQILPAQKQVWLISIPRDLWVSFAINQIDPETGETLQKQSKINSVFALGNSEPEAVGVDWVKNAISEIVGQPIDYYAAVDFNGFVKALEILTSNKGLEVNVPVAFTDEFYPIAGEEDNPCDWNEEEIEALSATLSGYQLEQQFPCRYETISFGAGKQLIEPTTLLKFARSRHSGSGGGDFGRSQRQQAVIAAVIDKALSPTMIIKIPALYEQYQKMAKTDVDLELITRALTNWNDLTSFSLNNIVLSNQNVLKETRAGGGQYVLIPQTGEDNYQQVQEFIKVSQQGLDWKTYLADQAASASAQVETTNE